MRMGSVMLAGEGNRTVDILGSFGLFLFAFASLLSTSGASLGLALLVGTMLLQPSAWRELRRDPLILLGVVSTLYLVARALWAMREFPETVHLQVRQARDWVGLWLFVVVAWWLKGDLRRSGRVLLLALLGLLVGVAGHLFTHGHILWSGQRTGFHLRAIAFGLYSGTAILGLGILAPRIWGNKDDVTHFAIRVGLWLISLAALVQGLIMTQSRGAWMAAALVIPPVTLLRYLSAATRRSWSWRRRLGFAASALLIATVLVLLNLRIISTRLSQEREVFAAAWRGDFDAVPTSGLGVRVHTLRFGLVKWLERPLLGWGPGSTEYLISRSGLPELRHSEWGEGGWVQGHAWLDHLHNTYLEILVRFGLVGCLLMVIVLGALVRGTWIAYRAGRLPSDYVWFLAGSLALISIWSLSDFRLLHPDWRSYWIILGGVVATFRWHLRPTDSSSLADTS